MMDDARARELLSSQRERIERSLADLAPADDEELSTLDQHPADQATDLYDDELDEGLADRLREELAALERAEERLEQGTFGLSVESGEPIPDGRLEAIPWAERTAAEQERYEQRG
jgi:DnaK suppressor protein